MIKSWMGWMGLLLVALGWPGLASAQSISLSSPASTYEAPANFALTIVLTNGTGRNRYLIMPETVILSRGNQIVYSGGTSYTEANLPVGTYSYSATATAFNPVTLHEYTVQSNTATVTVTTPPPPTGTISAVPTPCNIAMGSTTCSTTISWNTTSPSASVWVTDLNNAGAQLFASGRSGAQAATWITAAGARFHLKVGSQTLATVDVLGNPPPPPSGTLSSSQSPCDIAPGNTTCNVTVNWSSSNAPSASVWTSDLSNNNFLPFSNEANGSRLVVMPAATAQRFHLKFANLTLATLDIRANPLPPPSGTITASSGVCNIASGSAACAITINWNTHNVNGKATVRMTDLSGNDEALFAAGPNGTKAVLVTTAGARFQLVDVANNTVLATVSARATPPPPQSPAAYAAGKTETIEYRSDFSKWVLDQVKRTTTNGIETSRTEFDPATALPVLGYAFGKLQQTFSYNADGTVATIKDGNNHVTALRDWYRGIPRTIQYANGTTRSAVVNNHGWITAVTDETGAATGYGHDAMGRLASIVYPTADTTAWNTTTQVFAPVAAAEYGIAPGHWKQVVSTGNARKEIYFDALWRPLLTREYDAADVAGTQRFQRFAYDASGHLAFASYPGGTDSLGTGTWWTHDVLGRPRAVSQDSELGVLTTLTEYLPGFQVRTTTPRGHRTLISGFQAYDTPSYELPTVIDQPEGVRTSIMRDVFGKPVELSRTGAPPTDSSDNVGDGPPGVIDPPQDVQASASTQPLAPASAAAVVRRYVYDPHQQLCKVIEPETGATVMDYDGAGNLQWSASGLALPNASSCDTLAAHGSGRKVTRTYDARNRLHQLLFPDGRGNQTWQYAPDGLPAQITTYNDPGNATAVVNAYAYNKRRLLVGESLQQPGGSTWAIGYGYDANGSLASHTYPSGLAVTYAPNALAQPTQAGLYATGVHYFPNGAIKRFTYGNGVVHTMTQNARQLPATSGSSGGVHSQHFGYDQNGNVTSALDSLDGTRSRWMSYDGLDRLTGAGSVVFGGDHWHRFTYDAFDNMKSWKLAGVKDYANYVYDASNRLTNIQNSSGATVVGLSYDAQGNLLNKNGRNYSFDYGNRLREVVGRETYRYDGHGRRVLNLRPGNELTASQYSQSGQLMYQEQTGRGGLEHVYLGGSLIATRENGGVKYQHTDALGSPVAVTNAAGQVVERTNWEPYGAAIGKTIDGIGYTGHAMDVATGLTYMQQRYYDPLCGCFLSVDPVTAYSSGDMRFFNRYAYAFNNPYKFTDPDGRQSREFNFENQRLRVTPPPRAQGDWMGPAIGAAMTAVLAAPIAAELGMAALANPGAVATATNVAAGVAGVTGTAGGLSSTGGVVRQFRQTAPQTYFRVFSDDATVGRWLTSTAPKSSAWAQEALSLPPTNKATMIQKVLVPTGTRLERSRASAVPEWGRTRGGAEQFKLLDPIPPRTYLKTIVRA